MFIFLNLEREREGGIHRPDIYIYREREKIHRLDKERERGFIAPTEREKIHRPDRERGFIAPGL